MKKILLLIGILLIGGTSCKTASPKLTNAHAGKYIVGDKIEVAKDAIGFLDVQVAVVPVAGSKKSSKKAKTFFDLRDSIPHTFLKELGNNTTTGADFIKNIKEPLSNISKTPPSSLPTDFATQKVRFVLGNIKNYQVLATKENPEFLHPNTRLASLNTTLDFTSTDFHIVSIDKLESEFEDIDLGSLSRSQEANFTSKLTGQYGITDNSTSGSNSETGSNSDAANSAVDNVYDEDGNLVGTISASGKITDLASSKSSKSNTSTKGVGANGEIGYSNKETIAEALQVKLKRLKTGFVFNKDRITIAQHGSNLLDISDNVIVTATILPKKIKADRVLNFSNLFDKNGPLVADSIKVSGRDIKYFECESKNVKVIVSAQGLLRAVQNRMRGDNYLEFDDKVTYYPFELEENDDDTQINYWPNCSEIYSIRHTDASGKNYILMAGIGSIDEVHLKDDEKDKLFSWLQLVLKNPTIAKLKHPILEIYFKEIPRPGQAGGNIIPIVGSAMTPVQVIAIKNLPITFKKNKPKKKKNPK